MKYTTTRGVEVDVLPIPAMLVDKLAAQYKEPDPPTYEVKTLGGAIETHPLTEQSAETDEEKSKLADWQKRKAQVEQDRNRAFMKIVMLRGVRVAMPDNDDWLAEQRMMGVDVPDEPAARKLHYIETEVFGGLADYQNIARLVMEASGATEAAITQAADTFPGDVERNTA